MSRRITSNHRGEALGNARKLKRIINQQPVSTRSHYLNLRRPVEVSALETLIDVAYSVNEIVGGALQQTGGRGLVGASLLRQTELEALRRLPASRLGRYSLEFAFATCATMLPDSSQEVCGATITGLHASLPSRGQRHILLRIMAPTVSTERSRLVTGINAYEQADTGLLLDKESHVTLGYVPADQFESGYYNPIRQLGRQLCGSEFLLQPVEDPTRLADEY